MCGKNWEESDVTAVNSDLTYLAGFPWTTAAMLHPLCYREYASRRLPCKRDLESKEQHDKTDDDSGLLTQSKEAAQAWDPSGALLLWGQDAERGKKAGHPPSPLLSSVQDPVSPPGSPGNALCSGRAHHCAKGREWTLRPTGCWCWGSGLSCSLQGRHLILQQSGPRTHMGDPAWSLGPFGE